MTKSLILCFPNSNPNPKQISGLDCDSPELLGWSPRYFAGMLQSLKIWGGGQRPPKAPPPLRHACFERPYLERPIRLPRQLKVLHIAQAQVEFHVLMCERAGTEKINKVYLLKDKPYLFFQSLLVHTSTHGIRLVPELYAIPLADVEAELASPGKAFQNRHVSRGGAL